MAKKLDFDFKQFFLQRGEQVGLVVAGLLTLLLLGPAFYTFLFAGSASDKAAALDTKSAKVEFDLKDPSNVPSAADKPDPNAKLIALNQDVVDASPYAIQLADEVRLTGIGRRPPKIYGVDEALAEVAHLQIRTMIFGVGEPPRIMVLKSDPNAAAPGAPGGMPGMMPPTGLMNRFGNRGGGFTGLLGPGGRPGAGAAPKRRKREFNLLRAPQQGKADDGKADREMRLITLEEFDKNPTDPALRVQPLRMAVIAASFPYKKQVEEFKQKLGLRTTAEVLAETSQAGPDKQVHPNFRFLGVEVRRRELDRDGKPGKWEELDLAGDYKQYIVATAREFEPDDPELEPIKFDGLVMPRLRLVRQETSGAGMPGMPGIPGKGSMPPGLDKGSRPPATPERPAETTETKREAAAEYPAIEKKLVTLHKTLEALKGKSPAEVAQPKRFSAEGIDVFSSRTSTTPATGPGRMMSTDPKMRRPEAGDPKGPKSDMTQGTELPEHCLVRLLDVTVQPGKTYEYQLRIKMANPNYSRRGDVASPQYARDPELYSDWSEVPIVVEVKPELTYYAVDQKAYLFQKEAEPGSRPKYTGPHANDSIQFGPGDWRPFNRNTMVWLQVHKWVDSVTIGGGNRVEVGEWAVAERMPVYRGEYVGQLERVQVPYWRTARGTFLIANDGTNKRVPGVEVLFGYGLVENKHQPESILVDFHNGSIGYDRVRSRTEDKVETRRVSDDSAGEVLILNPDGKLILREVAADTNNAERQKQLRRVKHRILSVKNAGKQTSEKGIDP